MNIKLEQIPFTKHQYIQDAMLQYQKYISGGLKKPRLPNSPAGQLRSEKYIVFRLAFSPLFNGQKSFETFAQFECYANAWILKPAIFNTFFSVGNEEVIQKMFELHKCFNSAPNVVKELYEQLFKFLRETYDLTAALRLSSQIERYSSQLETSYAPI